VNKDDFFKDARHDLTGPMAGLLIVEATTTWAGPMAACIFADYGARVIKVEHPQGEIIRRLPPMLPDSDLTVVDQTVNRNKENLSLKLSNPQGRQIFLDLVTKADVVIENFKPGTMASWGLGYLDVKAVNPCVVYVSISAFGQFGVLSERPGYDPVAQNYAGWTSLNGTPGGEPTKAPTYLGDDMAGLHGALGAMAALRHRDVTGEGQHVDVSLVDSLLFQSNGNLTSGALGLKLERTGNQFSVAVPVNNYACRDGLVLAGILLDAHWVILSGMIGCEHMRDLDLAGRLQHRDEIDTALANWCAEHTVTQVVEIFVAAGLAVTAVNSYADAAKEPHVRDRDMLQQVQVGEGQKVPITGPANKFSRTPIRIRSPAPKLGEHNAAILGALGIDAAAQSRLRDDGVI
jgi:crotonobetainyl-CoA:carnitine CoA-transferase CaiB-like acyl-CoA transferase